MADLVITPADVSTNLSGRVSGIAGEAIEAGEVVYQATNNQYFLASASLTAVEANVVGVALNSAEAAGQPITILNTSGVYTSGAAGLTVSTTIVVSANAGKLAPEADLLSTNYKSIWGVVVSATDIQIGRNISGVQVP